MVPERKDLANSRGNGQPAVAYKSESGWQDVDQKDRRYFDRSSKSRWNWLVFLFTNFINFINRSFHVTNAESDRIRAAVQWNLPEGAEFEAGFRLVLNHFKPIKTSDVARTRWLFRYSNARRCKPFGAYSPVVETAYTNSILQKQGPYPMCALPSSEALSFCCGK